MKTILHDNSIFIFVHFLRFSLINKNISTRKIVYPKPVSGLINNISKYNFTVTSNSCQNIFFLPEHGHLKNHAATIIEIKYNVLKVLEEPFGDTTKKRGGQKSQFFSEKNSSPRY